MQGKHMIRNLADGLVVRHASPDDTEALAKFNMDIHAEGEWDAKGLEEWTLDLISGEGPTFAPGDFTIVEDTSAGEIVSSCCTISQTWSFEGIPFKVGRPEFVGTQESYRRKGLVREQFKILHQWSEARGELVQVITGIPYYYRQFGYEMTLDLGGGRLGTHINVPQLKEGEQEDYIFRTATESDIPFLSATYAYGCQRSMVYALWDEAQWRYEVTGKRKHNINRREIYIIENLQNERVGFIGLPPIKWGNKIVLGNYELAPGYAWVAVTPSVIRFLWQHGAQVAEEQNQSHEMFGFWLGRSHPAYLVAEDRLPQITQPYTFYIRVSNLTAFLQTIQPVLERRLAGSAFACYTGDLKLSFYKEGLGLDFENGKIKAVKRLGHDELKETHASFHPLTFLHLVFGHRSMAELSDFYTDCFTRDKATKNLIDTLFPKKLSAVWPVS
jgi:hypothetical protein